MTSELVLANARVVTPDEVVHGLVQVEDGRIADIARGAGVPFGAIDLETRGRLRALRDSVSNVAPVDGFPTSRASDPRLPPLVPADLPVLYEQIADAIADDVASVLGPPRP